MVNNFLAGFIYRVLASYRCLFSLFHFQLCTFSISISHSFHNVVLNRRNLLMCIGSIFNLFLLNKARNVCWTPWLTFDSMVPVLRNKALKFRFYMYLKEGLYTWTFEAQYLIYFLRLHFLRWRLHRRISQKIAPRRKIHLFGI